MKPNALVIALATVLVLGGMNPIQAAEAVAPQMATAPSAPEAADDQRPLALGLGAIGGVVLFNMATCGLITSALVGGFVGDYLYRRYHHEQAGAQ